MGTNGDPIMVTSDIVRRCERVTKAQIEAVPLAVLPPDTVTMGEVDQRIPRLCVVREEVRGECKELEAKGPSAALDLMMEKELLAIIEGHIRLGIWRQFSELAGKTYVIYEKWRVGPEKSDVETRDLFAPAEAKSPRSTRSKDVNIGAVRHASA